MHGSNSRLSATRESRAGCSSTDYPSSQRKVWRQKQRKNHLSNNESLGSGKYGRFVGDANQNIRKTKLLKL